MRAHTREKGITLIALVVTIIVLLILAGVSIQMLTGQNGILKRAREASEKTGRANVIELAQIEIADKETENRGPINKEELHDILKEYFTNVPEVEDEVWDNFPEGFPELKATEEYGGYEGIEVGSIYKGTLEKSAEKVEESKVGYYADIDDDGTVDGIIYADLAKGNTRSGQWYNNNGAYEIPQITEGLKEYYISQETYSGAFGEAPVLSPAPGTEGKERFYIMTLEDLETDGETRYCWYDAAYGSIDSSITKLEFGEGITNTKTMIEKWNEPAYTQNDGSYKDVWGVVQDKYKEGWFVPSKAEWAAFAEELGISKSNYPDKELSDYYWSSSLNTSGTAWLANFDNGYMNNNFLDSSYSVRLSTTF